MCVICTRTALLADRSFHDGSPDNCGGHFGPKSTSLCPGQCKMPPAFAWAPAETWIPGFDRTVDITYGSVSQGDCFGPRSICKATDTSRLQIKSRSLCHALVSIPMEAWPNALSSIFCRIEAIFFILVVSPIIELQLLLLHDRVIQRSVAPVHVDMYYVPFFPRQIQFGPINFSLPGKESTLNDSHMTCPRSRSSISDPGVGMTSIWISRGSSFTCRVQYGRSNINIQSHMQKWPPADKYTLPISYQF